MLVYGKQFANNKQRPTQFCRCDGSTMMTSPDETLFNSAIFISTPFSNTDFHKSHRYDAHMSPRFPYHLPYATLNLRASPHLYRIGRGEEGVLSVEPYKSELLPLWRFKDPEVARESSNALYAQFQEYRKEKDFVGCDMARKFIQMGVTRARRYANHKGGKKYQVTGEWHPSMDFTGRKLI